MQENFTFEFLDSHVRHGIPSRLNGHGHEALDILETIYNQEVFPIAQTIANSQVLYSTIQSKGHKCEAKMFISTHALSGSNLEQTKRLGIKQCGFALMIRIDVCWEMFQTL